VVDLTNMMGDIPLDQQVILADASVLTISEVKRYLPNRRVVCKGIWQEQIVFAKLFIGKNAAKYAQRDKAGVIALSQASINTPTLLKEIAIADNQGLALIFKVIEPAPNAEELWQVLNPSSRLALMRQLVETVAQHHQAGLIQTDLYLKNFLVQDATIYTLDGDGIRSLSPFFKKRQQLRNLATLFSKMDVLDDEWIQDLYETYCNKIGTMFSIQDAAGAWALTQSIRAEVSSEYADEKVFRTCTDVKVTQDFKYFTALATDFQVDESTLHTLDSFLVNPSNNIKNGNTCTIAKAQLANQEVVVKRYNIKSFAHGFSRAFRQTRAAKSWANAHRLMISGIATPKPLALVEERLGCLRRRAYFLSEYVDAPDVLQYFTQSKDKKAVADHLAMLFYKLYLLKFSHGDCKASNIKIVGDEPMLIDLDGMKAHSNNWLTSACFNRQHVKDLKRFMANWSADAEVTALLKRAFVQKYNEQYPFEDDPILQRAGIA
jgi:tRNA A-37 threonylcarbamoyl transferase component Bud32